MDCLIVDDEQITIDSVMQTIKNMKPELLPFNRMLSAFNIMQAKQLLQTHDINLVICDIEMPMGSGLELLQWMRENGYNIDFILLTCYADFTYIKKSMKYGCLDYLLKPIVLDEITEVMERIISRNKKQDAREKEYCPISESEYNPIEKIKQYIAMNLDKELNRSTLSNYVHLNPDYLNRIFKEETSMSLIEYVILERMNRAKDLLKNTDLSIYMIAKKVGYDQYSHFAASFKQRVGISPLDYRNKSVI